MPAQLPLIISDQEPRVDSRIIAGQLGVEHESFRKLIYQYQADFEEFGILRFEIGEIKGRGQPEKYALLNEDQSYLGLTYAQNTPRRPANSKSGWCIPSEPTAPHCARASPPNSKPPLLKPSAPL